MLKRSLFQEFCTQKRVIFDNWTSQFY